MRTACGSVTGLVVPLVPAVLFEVVEVLPEVELVPLIIQLGCQVAPS